MARIIPFPDRPQQPLRRQVHLPPHVVAFLEEAAGEPLDAEQTAPDEARMSAAEAFSLMQAIAARVQAGR